VSLTTIDPAHRAKLQACLASRYWRLRNLYWIQDEDGNLIKFSPNVVQELLDAALHTRNLILKSRQHGFTTFACIRQLDTVLFESGVRCGIVADTLFNAQNFFRNKIIFAYERLPAWLKASRPIERQDMTGELVIGHGEDPKTKKKRSPSSITVGTSLRSGTNQRIHVSEMGPMAARFPLRAAETVSGTLNAIGNSGIVTIESTAEGAFGPFYRMCQTAISTANLVKVGEAKLTALDYKFFFFAWWEDPTNVLDEPVYLNPEYLKYFAEVEQTMDCVLTLPQRQWYVKKAEEQGDKMWSQFPSTPEEAFKASTEGAYFARELNKAERDGRVCDLPFVPGIPVNTWWDLGRNDLNVIWFHQEVGGWNHFIDCYFHAGEGAAHYAKKVRDIADERGYVYGCHYLPHDGEVKDYSQGDNRPRKQVLEDLGLKRIVIVPRIENLQDGIEMARQAFARCKFEKRRLNVEKPKDSGISALGGLRQYRKEWNEKGQCWSDHPFHDWTRNFADAFRQFAQHYKTRSTPDRPHAAADTRPTGPYARRTTAIPRWKTS
jgi:hypothetical protein